MKKFLICLLLSVCFASCNSEKKIHVSEVPIKTNVLGIELCKKVNYRQIDDILYSATKKEFYIQEELISDNIIVYRCLPYNFSFYYGGQSWSYIDIRTINKQVYNITIYGSYTNINGAQKQYDSILMPFEEKYGKSNFIENDTTIRNACWTDNINSISLAYYEGNSVNGNSRSFCELGYSNNELYNQVSNKRDI